ncbi:MAG: WD40 repeat domain-containing protein, partial [Bacteroidales bacterium]|nr:WD40 repeat domain-containing protein [Bacteroidales bacterium]
MKKILKKSSFILLFVLSFAIQSVSQTNPYVITVDTLENEQAIVTLERTDGLFYSQYLFLEPPYEFNFDEGTDNSTYTDDDPDVFWGNIEFPNEYGACMPRDVFYNVPNHSYYVYGGKKIIIIDGSTMEKTGEIIVSDAENIFISNLINLNPEKRIIGNQDDDYPLIYCATEDGKLVIIDANTNQIVKEIGPPVLGSLIKASVIYSSEANAAFWYFSKGNDDYNRIGRIVNQTETNSMLVDYGINDIICDPDGDFLYISSTSGIYSLGANDLSHPQHLIFDGAGCMVYGDDKLFAYRLGVKEMFCYDFLEESYYDFNISYSNISKMVFNPDNTKLYYTGTINDETDNNSGIGIAVKVVNNFSQVEAYDYNTAIGLIYNSGNNKTYCGSYNKIVSINGYDNAICAVENLDGSYCYDLETGYSGQIISLQNVSGNALLLDEYCIIDETLNLGGLVIGSCVKESENGINKSYFLVDKNNFNSYLIEVDNNSNQVLNEIEMPEGLIEMSISCNKENDYIYIEGLNYSKDKVLYEFNHEEVNFTKVIDDEDLIILGTFAAPNDKLYVFLIDNSHDSKPRYIYIMEPPDYIDPVKLELNETACLKDTKYYNDFVYFVSSCSKEIFIVNGETNQLENQNNFSFIDPPPYSIAFNETDNVFFVGQSNKISKYDYAYSSKWEESIQGVNEIAKIISNPYSKYVYGLSPDFFIVVNTEDDYNIEYEKYEHDSDLTDMEYDSINNRLYIYSVVNDEKKGNLWIWDCHNNEELGKIYFDINYNYNSCSYSELGIAPMISFVPGKNKLFTSNQSFSNISVIDCFTDRLNLYSGWTWLSFPRMERSLNNPMLTVPVLQRINYFPTELGLFDRDNDSKEFDFENSWTGELDNVKSTVGYKLDLSVNDGSVPNIALHGAKLDPETEMTLEPIVENWVGYFLEEAQYPRDAFGEQWMNEHLSVIKTQYWTMIKVYFGNEYIWRTDDRITPFEYGDMVILITDEEEAIPFQWISSGYIPLSLNIPQPEYFTYEEKADYIPFYVEFDSTSDIQEIAIIADGEYKGAAVRLEGDTIVELNAYLEGTPAGAPLEFETWNGFKASNVKDNYLVFDHQLQTNVKRQIYAGENRQYYVISLRKGEEFNIPENISEAYCRPNPFTGETNVTFRLNKSQNTKVEIFNLSGKSIKTLMEGEFPAGL